MPIGRTRFVNLGVTPGGRGAPALAVLTTIGGLLWLTGCRTPDSPSPGEILRAKNERHVALFGDFELPRRLGSVENVNLQIPTISPDGNQMLYLRTDRDFLSPMTLLGSTDPDVGFRTTGGLTLPCGRIRVVPSLT